MKKSKRWLAILVSVFLFIGMISGTLFAEEADEPSESVIESTEESVEAFSEDDVISSEDDSGSEMGMFSGGAATWTNSTVPTLTSEWTGDKNTIYVSGTPSGDLWISDAPNITEITIKAFSPTVIDGRLMGVHCKVILENVTFAPSTGTNLVIDISRDSELVIIGACGVKTPPEASALAVFTGKKLTITIEEDASFDLVGGSDLSVVSAANGSELTIDTTSGGSFSVKADPYTKSTGFRAGLFLLGNSHNLNVGKGTMTFRGADSPSGVGGPGIRIASGGLNISIEGGGVLSASGGHGSSYMGGHGIYGPSYVRINYNGGTVNAQAGDSYDNDSRGINLQGSLIIEGNGGILNAKGGVSQSKTSYGIFVDTMTINGSAIINATGGTTGTGGSIGVYSESGNIKMGKDSVLNATGGTAGVGGSNGIWLDAGSLIIDEGKVVAKGTDRAIYMGNDSFGDYVIPNGYSYTLAPDRDAYGLKTTGISDGSVLVTAMNKYAAIEKSPWVNAAALPSISGQPLPASPKMREDISLSVDATQSDGGTLTFQWYSNFVNRSVGGERILGATQSTYNPPTDVEGTTYYYCVITNTNNNVSGEKTRSITTDVVAVVVAGVAPTEASTSTVSTNPTSSTDGTAITTEDTTVASDTSDSNTTIASTTLLATSTKKAGSSTTPKTGDNAGSGIWITIAIASTVGGIVTVIALRKKNKQMQG